MTLWLTNLWFAAKPESPESPEKPDCPEVAPTLQRAQEEFDRFTAQDATFIFVTNEIGSGGVSSSPVQRRFTDLEGWMNQYIAQKADEVILMVSGIAVKVKK